MTLEFLGSGVSAGGPVVFWLFFWWFGKFHMSCKASQHPCSLISTRSNNGGILLFSWVLNAQVFCECYSLNQLPFVCFFQDYYRSSFPISQSGYQPVFFFFFVGTSLTFHLVVLLRSEKDTSL